MAPQWQLRRAVASGGVDHNLKIAVWTTTEDRGVDHNLKVSDL